ncbi:alkaline phosphatase family protein [Robertkochia solimangrovi]|uniref:alkaline phosphatase family protein n=1 Tax=Robertkochia solimangrovi TaxID=2213046 RepID=UPI00117CD1B0|nr:nucleotide pyrophosphatase/phosphodiesterase family protein [Robertkochia solimangrovi]TRZ42969.1 alkaline phosphatase family protein [Robertkochia solimangrovi]
MKKTVVLNVVGLTPRLIGRDTPFIQKFVQRGKSTIIEPVLPAVTCSVQSTYLTGKWPETHGVVGNGWYFKDELEVKFWRQSNRLVESPKIWDELKKQDPEFTCANMFWWYNMYSTADYSVTPRPNYLADGRKLPDIYSFPAGLRDELQEELGTFPLFDFWGPRTSIKSSKWIADASILTDKKYDPTLTLVYLPHLDYNLQRYGHDMEKIASDLQEIDAVVEELVTYYERKNANVILLSEYGITDVSNPVHVNRILRENGWLAIREERGLELLDAGASKAFAVADHQVCHVYLNDPKIKNAVISALRKTTGIKEIMGKHDQQLNHISHERSGDLVLVSDENSWFTYYFWLDDSKAPDFARIVDIHKKPGYDPVEMFTDPGKPFIMARVLWKLFKKKLGFRVLMDVIPLDAKLVKGSHGRIPESKLDYPVLVSNVKDGAAGESVSGVEVYDIIKQHITNSKIHETIL